MREAALGLDVILALAGVAAVGLGANAVRNTRGEVAPLCRSCLLIAPPYCTCSGCGAEISPRSAEAASGGRLRCRRCAATLVPALPAESGASVRAQCQYCRQPFHLARTAAPCRVVAVLRPEDYEYLRAAVEHTDDYRRGLAWFFTEGRDGTLCVLQLGEEEAPEVFYPPNHALHYLEALWIGRDNASALGLARLLDRLALRHGDLFAGGQVQVWAEDLLADPVMGRGLEAWALERSAPLRSGVDLAELLDLRRLRPGKRTTHTYAHPPPE